MKLSFTKLKTLNENLITVSLNTAQVMIIHFKCCWRLTLTYHDYSQNTADHKHKVPETVQLCQLFLQGREKRSENSLIDPSYRVSLHHKQSTIQLKLHRRTWKNTCDSWPCGQHNYKIKKKEKCNNQKNRYFMVIDAFSFGGWLEKKSSVLVCWLVQWVQNNRKHSSKTCLHAVGSLQWILPPANGDEDWSENSKSNVEVAVIALIVHMWWHTNHVVDPQEAVTCLSVSWLV